jgi:hypothetical protein
MKYKTKTLKIFTCEECPCLGADNRCDETEDYIDHEIAVSGPIPENCPLEDGEEE